MAKKKTSIKKTKKKPKYNLRTRITSALRKVWYYGQSRREAVKIAKARGNTCAICNVPQNKLQIDHIIPCAATDGSEHNWSGFIDRLFCPPEGLRAICKECHSVFTALSAAERKLNKQ